LGENASSPIATGDGGHRRADVLPGKSQWRGLGMAAATVSAPP
jgi:hypothetical protein